MTETTWKW